jgi:hypothetical protein
MQFMHKWPGFIYTVMYMKRKAGSPGSTGDESPPPEEDEEG